MTLIGEEKYYQYGPDKLKYFQAGSGKVVLFLHGGGVQASSYRGIFNYLSQKYLVFAPDLPCFGKSSVPATVWGYDDYANFLIKFICFLKVKKIAVIGHSLGGGIGLSLATKSKKVSHLVLIDSAGSKIKYSKAKFLYKFFVEKTVRDILKYKNAPVLFSLIKDFLGNLFSRFYKGKQIYKIMTSLLGTDFSEFDKIRIPTLILWGKQDEIFPPSVAKTFQQKIKKSELRFVDGNHDWCLYHPEKFFNIADNWLNQQ